jgi:hypothetical protein
MLLTLHDVCLKIVWSPYESKVGGFMEKFNDFFVLNCAYFPYLFTDLIPSQEDKYYIGWYYNGIICTMIVANIIVVVMIAFEKAKKWVSVKIKICRLKKATEAQNANREEQEKSLKLLVFDTEGVPITILKPR